MKGLSPRNLGYMKAFAEAWPEKQERDYEFQQLKTKLEQGAAEAERGILLDGDEVFGELREMIEERRLSQAVNR